MRFGEWKSPRQKSKPLELEWCHKETIGHKASESLKIERRRIVPCMAQFSNRGWLLLVKFVDLNGYQITVRARSIHHSRFVGCDQLCNCICDSTKHL